MADITTTTVEPTVTTTTAEPLKKDENLSALIAAYKKSYPKEKTFHVTSDKQVFLSKDLDMAKLHQKSVSVEGGVQTIKA